MTPAEGDREAKKLVDAYQLYLWYEWGLAFDKESGLTGEWVRTKLQEGLDNSPVKSELELLSRLLVLVTEIDGPVSEKLDKFIKELVDRNDKSRETGEAG